MKERNYGIDLLRIVAMFMIVMLHVLGNGGVLNCVTSGTIKGEIIWGIEIICYCSVNCFALVSGYVGLNSKHKYSNIISLCLQVVFYCLLFTGIYTLFKVSNGEDLNIYFIAKSLIPTLFNRYWYFSAYFCLFFFMPILNHIVEKIDRNYLRILGLFIFIIVCCITIFTTNVFDLKMGYSMFWLAILYVIGAYIKKYNPFEKLSIFKNLIIFLLSILLTSLSKIFIPIITQSILGQSKGALIFVSYISPTILIAAIALLNIFSKINVNKCAKLIKIIAPTTFGIYLIHCQPVFYDLFLYNHFSFLVNYNTIQILGISISAGIIIFLSCFIIDYLRQLLFKLLNISKLITGIEKLFSKITNFILKPLKTNQQTTNDQ